jgi:hypothetical protein
MQQHLLRRTIEDFPLTSHDGLLLDTVALQHSPCVRALADPVWGRAAFQSFIHSLEKSNRRNVFYCETY